MSESDLRGTLSKIRFYRDNYLIGYLDTGDCVKGLMLSPQLGLEYSFRGRWDHHPKWGKQFSFVQYEIHYPSDADAVQSYLESNCKWIGPVISERLFAAYGDKVLEICKDDPARVATEIPGITPSRAIDISEMLLGNERNEKLQISLANLLSGINISTRMINKIISALGSDAPDQIRENPYILIDTVDGIGFLKADSIAMRIGYAGENPIRVRAGIRYTLQEQANSHGHTCFPGPELVKTVCELLSVSVDSVCVGLDFLEHNDELVLKNGSFFLRNLYDDEILICEKLWELMDQYFVPSSPDFDELADDQKEALQKAVANGVFILTGAPGTGKTYTIKRIISSFPNSTFALAAPTGKAAKRMLEQSGHAAVTVHSLLEPKPFGEGFIFTRDAKKPLGADIIILDEVSMMDTWLMARFLSAVAPGTRLILVGDTYQLPSIGPGNILKDMIASGRIPTTELTTIKRQSEGLIIRNCHRIKNGEIIDVLSKDASDFFFIPLNDEFDIQSKMLDLVYTDFVEAYDADPLRDVQIIVPLRKRTVLSCKILNEVCQDRFNPNPVIDGCKFKLQDKVIQTRNRYNLGILNGDIGYVKEIDRKEQLITVVFENPKRSVNLPLWDNDLDLAYAITCHKFQGSEAKYVVIPIHSSFGSLIMQRNWLYTAISRAQEVCVLVGHFDEVERIIRRNFQQRRHTGLLDALTIV